MEKQSIWKSLVLTLCLVAAFLCGLLAGTMKNSWLTGIFEVAPGIIIVIELNCLDFIERKARKATQKKLEDSYGRTLTRETEFGNYEISVDDVYEAIEKLGYLEHHTMKGEHYESN